MKRGEIWIGNLNPNRGAEIGKVRPMLIIQEDQLSDAGLPTVVVLPLTTQVRAGLRHLRVLISARDRLRQDCQVMVDQPRALDRKRLGEGPLTSLTAQEQDQVNQALRVVLGLF